MSGEASTEFRLIAADAIRSFIGRSLVAVGLTREDAARVAELMTEADLTGADAHGVFRLPQICEARP
jgi:LDH2 family malate/lactate/ureidoglycolate dehydrogenase